MGMHAMHGKVLCIAPSSAQSHALCAVQAAADNSATRLHEFATQAVSNTMWGCANMDFYHDKLLEAAAADLVRMSCRPGSPAMHVANVLTCDCCQHYVCGPP